MTVTPYLMFEKIGEEAMRFYVTLFDGDKVLEEERYGPDDGAPEGSLKTARFTIKGSTYGVINSPTPHDFSHTPSFSIFVDCTSEAELDALNTTLSEGGSHMMPPGDYGFSKKFTWLKDRFGVSWQLNFV